MGNFWNDIVCALLISKNQLAVLIGQLSTLRVLALILLSDETQTNLVVNLKEICILATCLC